MNLEEIRQLIDLAKETGVAELEVQRAENRVRIRLAGATYEVGPLDGNPAPKPVSPAELPKSPIPPPAVETSSIDAETIVIKSPIVGTFYEAPSPDTDPFVKVGDSVSPGKVICIIESMKLMNEIESEHTGVITARLVENGHAVEYGEPLFALRLA